MEIRGQGDPSSRSGEPCGTSTVQGQPDLPPLGSSFRRGRGAQAPCEIATSLTATTQYPLVHFSVTLCLALKRIFGIADHAAQPAGGPAAHYLQSTSGWREQAQKHLAVEQAPQFAHFCTKSLTRRHRRRPFLTPSPQVVGTLLRRAEICRHQDILLPAAQDCTLP
jgi:hypothetical protein